MASTQDFTATPASVTAIPFQDFQSQTPEDRLNQALAQENSDQNTFDKVKLSINGKDITEIRSFIITRDVFEATTSFEFSIDPYSDSDLNLYKEVQNVYIWINDKLYLNGWLDAKSYSYDKQGRVLKIRGRDKMSAWADNNITMPKQYTGGVANVINSLLADNLPDHITGIGDGTQFFNCNAKGLKYYITAEAQIIINQLGELSTSRKIDSQYGDSIFQFVSNLISPYGLILYYSTSEDAIYIDKLFNKNGDIDYINAIKEHPYFSGIFYISNSRTSPSTVESCTYEEDITNYHKYIKVIGESNQSYEVATYDPTSLTQKVKLKFFNNNLDTEMTGLNKIYAHKMQLHEATYTQKKTNRILDNAAQTLRKAEIKKAVSYNYLVRGLSQSGIAFDVNTPFSITDEFVGLNGQALTAYKIEMRGSKERQETNIYLCMTEAQVPQIYGGSDLLTGEVGAVAKEKIDSNNISKSIQKTIQTQPSEPAVPSGITKHYEQKTKTVVKEPQQSKFPSPSLQSGRTSRPWRMPEDTLPW